MSSSRPASWSGGEQSPSVCRATITCDKSAFSKPSVITLTAGPLELKMKTHPRLWDGLRSTRRDWESSRSIAR
jgi:hypothetical protein